jgi:hypothetical protein
MAGGPRIFVLAVLALLAAACNSATTGDAPF